MRNKSPQTQQYDIPAGNMATPLTDPKKQTMVATKGLKGFLNPGETKTIEIDTACYNRKKLGPNNELYNKTNIVDKNIKEGMDQTQIWNYV